MYDLIFCLILWLMNYRTSIVADFVLSVRRSGRWLEYLSLPAAKFGISFDIHGHHG
jgi:hypothetical protein